MMSISPPSGQSTVAEKDQLVAVNSLSYYSGVDNLQSWPCSTNTTWHMQEAANDQTLVVESVTGDANTLPAGAIGLELARIVTVVISRFLTSEWRKDCDAHSSVRWAVTTIDETIVRSCGFVDILYTDACK